MRALFPLVFCLFALAAPLPAQGSTHTPPAGRAERRAILESARRAVQARVGRQPVRFRVDHLRVRSGWAFLLARPQRPDGRALDYRGTPYREALEAGAFDDEATVLLRRERGAWRVADFDLGATDVVWEDWPERHGAPREIFPGWGAEPP